MYVSQSIHRPQGVNVFGSCLIRTEPDYASLRFTVSSVAQEPSEAFAVTRERVSAVRQVLADAGVDARDVRSERVSMALAFEGYGDGRRSVGYTASMAFQVFLHDLEQVEQLLIDVVAAGARLIDSVNYKSSRLKDLRREARQGAVQAARVKARTYAEAVGLELGKALHIEDVNPDQLARRSHAPDVDLEEHDESETAGSSTGSIVVAGAVMACFALVG